ncbi:MAG: hypothetical protein COA75_12470 [Cellvibrionales bacterium]|nr:MAG: hypothetical protein COA75_12470 [Cellvibrionales bacterium]
MANLSVRKLDDEVVTELRIRAAQHGISMEEEVRRIIVQAVSAPARLGDLALATFGGDLGIEPGPEKKAAHEPMDF